MIFIDRVTTDVELTEGPAAERPEPPAPPSATAGVFHPESRSRFRDLVLDVLRDHLRDLERRGLR